MNFSEKIRELYSDNVEMLKIMIEEREYFRLVLFQNFFHQIKMCYLSGYKKKYEDILRCIQHYQKALCSTYDEIIEHFDEIPELKEDFETEIINYLKENYAIITSGNTEFEIDFTRYKNLWKYMKNIIDEARGLTGDSNDKSG